MVDLGTDINGFPDYGLLDTLVSGNVALCQRICRRLTNDRGSWSWAPDECTNILDSLNSTLTDERISTIQSDVEREVEREEVVASSSVSVVASPLNIDIGQSVTISINGTTGNGPFKFVLFATALTLTILKAG